MKTRSISWRSPRWADSVVQVGSETLAFVDGRDDGGVELVGRLAALDSGDHVVGEPGVAAHGDVVEPLVLAVHHVRDAQDGQLAQPCRQRRTVQQVEVESQEAARQFGVTHQRSHQVPGRLGIAALSGHQAGQSLVDGLVPLVRRQWSHSHRRPPLVHENQILIFEQ